MNKPTEFITFLKEHGIRFYSGVPDSLLKGFCNGLSNMIESRDHIIAANEGSAIALGIGHYLATGSVPLVYMQNSGIGNAINPLLSLADKDIYSIPMLLMIGWRGRPGVKDEPQHNKQGAILTDLLGALQIPYKIIDSCPKRTIDSTQRILNDIRSKSRPMALVAKENSFSKVDLKVSNASDKNYLTREEAIESIVKITDSNDIIVATTGMASRELFEIRKAMKLGHNKDFLTVGGMGHASQIALSIALNQKKRKVFCLDGDGSTLMHMGSLATNGFYNLTNFTHVLLNNGTHDSVGGQPTVGLQINFASIAKSCGYSHTYKVKEKDQLKSCLSHKRQGSIFIEFLVKPGNRNNLGRPTLTPLENRTALMKYIRGTDK